MSPRRCLASLLIVFLFLSSLGVPSLHAEPWNEGTPLSGSPSGTVVERGANYVITSLGGNRFSWESAPQWVSNGVDWVPYIYSRDEAKKCYQVQVGFVAAKIYDSGVVELYDPTLSEVRVKEEIWEVWSSGKQATLNAPITWGVVANSSGVFVSRWQTTSKPDGLFQVVYSFVVGASLKHTVKWTSGKNAVSGVQVKQIHLMDFDKVTTDTGTINRLEEREVNCIPLWVRLEGLLAV